MFFDFKDLNVKQMGFRYLFKIYIVLFSFFDILFGCICLFFLKYSCVYKLGIKGYRQKFFLEMFCFFLREDGKGKNLVILLMVG